MPSTLPDGEPAPRDGRLPDASRAAFGTAPFGVYLHVPFCATRCGYCDFNTNTASELVAPDDTTVTPTSYVDSALAELRLAAQALGEAPPVQTVFVGGGTPTLLPAADLGRLVAGVRELWGLADDADVTTEANPESVDLEYLQQLRKGGFTRVSFGMQSAREHVLRVLDRRHTPGRPQQCVAWAREAGFEHVNLDLIYGTPGETDEDWQASLDAAVAAGPDHVSAYALIVEGGTRLAGQVRRGVLPMPDDDVLADRYLMADATLSAAGLEWYEVSNWAATPQARSAHNLLYWTGGDWWGIGPGAHSHVAGTRWWNVKHPAAYAAALARGDSPAAGRELLSEEDRYVERVLLELRLRDGLPLSALRPEARSRVPQLVADGLVEPDALGMVSAADRVTLVDAAGHPGPGSEGRLVLTLRGRLLADAVVRDLLD
ncbi:MAG: radical SAM family heme chaperone HemW [Actinomycetes bacterium]